jgi:uncharacterized protein (DUF111 family)
MLILAQIDDRSGEVLGHALEELMSLGARNVQLLGSVTKKGRPGSVLLVDLDHESETDVAAYLAAELGVWGYHVLESSHRHFDTTLEDREVTVVCGARSQVFAMPCKFFYHDGGLVRVKVERNDVEKVQRFANVTDDACASDTVRSRLEHDVRRRPTSREIEVHLW